MEKNYKELYEQALERAVKLRDDLLKNGTLATAKGVESIFPELKESEDDVMRKMAIKAVHAPEAQSCIKSWGIEPDDVIAWLEKQGEKHIPWYDLEKSKEAGYTIVPNDEYERLVKPVEWSKEDKLKMDTLVHIITKQKGSAIFEGFLPEELIGWLWSFKGRVTPQQKHGEQKPNYCHHEVDLSGCSEEYCKAYYDGWNNCNQQHAQLEAEQKPTWSEEDEQMLIGLIYEISGLINHATPFQTSVYAKYLAWLNSIKERVLPQPKQEWSEEDENIRGNLLGYLNGFSVSETAKHQMFDWLKSLRPQNKTYYWTENEVKFAISDYIRGAESYEKMVEKLRCLKPLSQWKPSDEQMEYLSKAILTLGNEGDGKTASILNELRTNLKKLKG